MPESRLIALRLAKEGFGTPAQIEAMPVGMVMDALHFTRFVSDYQDVHRELNKEQK